MGNLTRTAVLACGIVSFGPCATSWGQSPSVIYTWDGTGDIRGWAKGFGTNTATLSNTNAGELTLAETGTAGSTIAFNDNGNRVRETPSAPTGGLDLTGLSFLEFDLGQNGGAAVNVQFYVQASTGSTFRALGADLAVQPGVATYKVPLSGLLPNEQVYIRTLGFNARDHAAQGNLTWTLREVRSVGTPLTQRDIATHDVGTVENGLQGALVNFDRAAVSGNGNTTQGGLSQNASGSASLQWTDLGGSNGAAISWGNGTALNNNTFNNRTSDLSNYTQVTFRISATDPTNAAGLLSITPFIQANSTFQAITAQDLITDGQFHELTFSLAGLTNTNVVDQLGINLGAHATDLVINVDFVRVNQVVPEPVSLGLLTLAVPLLARRRTR